MSTKKTQNEKRWTGEKPTNVRKSTKRTTNSECQEMDEKSLQIFRKFTKITLHSECWKIKKEETPKISKYQKIEEKILDIQNVEKID